MPDDAVASAVRIENRGDVALILIDNPPVNASSQAVRKGLVTAIEAANKDAAVAAIVIACEGRTFVAGADIREFGKPPLPPALPDVLTIVEASGKPVVAAVHGTALGGGFELALACHARVLDPGAIVGLPEVKLGLIPGAGGTQRLPRLIGVRAAIDLAASGRQVKADEALALGIADSLAAGDLRDSAIALARSLVGRPIRRLSELAPSPFDRAEIDAALAGIAQKSRGQASPLVAARTVLLAAELPFAEGMARERAAFIECLQSDQSKAMRYVFMAEREAPRAPQLEGIAPRKVERVGIIGAGTMGAGIAVAFTDGGFSVIVVETSEAAVEAGRKRIAAPWDRQLKSGRLTASQHEARSASVAVGSDFAALAACDLVVEAAFEDMDVKKDIFARLGAIAKPGAVLATNTSYLDVGIIAQASGRPGDVIGLHFFSPANVMRLVEVVEAPASAKDAVATGVAVAKKLGKIAVVCGVCDGFIGNRILAHWRPIVDMMVEDGAAPQGVDGALEEFGFAMGPYAVGDLAGLDIGWARRKRLAPTLNPNVRYASTIADELCALGRFGQKTGAGWYSYSGGKKALDPLVSGLIDKVRAQKHREQRVFSNDTIQRLVRAAIVNEGAKVLSDGIARRALDIDVVLISGYGYPAWRGGPMFEADALGLGRILADIEEAHAFAGAGYEPAPLIVSLARADRRFADLAPGEAAGGQ
ncbi:3-hydroxyacyl-CoA dehydrogenase NAD-binding domain-containing protein [Methylocapsa sp. S129]|uniref:3-hydroxyacyl-CoA dehydrogenase NAD-binding domain-containing protein n=1 Tax=Methylocapsa sp. S129 TaxID=1641869 RepID=UPI00131C8394|nr:3-hydroxyacyl-CoA dehydrogenase NAD-binding domain-containing protein [Methylocapsa sp. S129]